MHLTSDGEKMFAWAKEEQTQQITNSIFSNPDKTADSYYEKFDGKDEAIYDYEFSDFMQLKQQLNELWKETYMQKMVLISSVSAMKGILSGDDGIMTESENKKCNMDSILPEYVYVF